MDRQIRPGRLIAALAIVTLAVVTVAIVAAGCVLSAMGVL